MYSFPQPVIRWGILFISTYLATAAPRRNKVSQSWIVTLMNRGALYSILYSGKRIGFFGGRIKTVGGKGSQK